MEKTQQALARSRRASRREAAQNDTQHVDTQDTTLDSASASQDASTAQDEVEHVDVDNSAVESASVPQDESTAQHEVEHVEAQDNADDSASAVHDETTAQHLSVVQEALAHAKALEQEALDAAKAARKVAQQAQRDFERAKLEVEQQARAAHEALYKIDVVTAGPLDVHRDLRQALLAGGAIALHAFHSAVASGVLTVRVKKARVARATRDASTFTRTSEERSTTPRAPGRVMTAEEISDVLARSAQGETVASISAAHGLHHLTVRGIIAGRIVAK